MVRVFYQVVGERLEVCLEAGASPYDFKPLQVELAGRAVHLVGSKGDGIARFVFEKAGFVRKLRKIQKVTDLFGCWKYYDDSGDKESDLFGVYVDVDGEYKSVGYVGFYQTDGVIAYANIKVNVNMVDMLK